jgi:hypothetical protein
MLVFISIDAVDMLRRCGRLVAGGKGGDDAFRLMAGP